MKNEKLAEGKSFRLTCKGLRLPHDFQGEFGLPSVEYYNRLAELEDEIECGHLIELPCKVGDDIYTV